jgi:protein SCO1/2
MSKKKIINKQIKLALVLAVPIIILLVTKWHIIGNILPKISDKDNLPTLAKITEKPVPAFKFVNQDFDTITNETYKDKIYIVDFIFTTCPTICPKMTFHMRHLVEELEKYDNVAFLSHTINPEYDTPDTLKKYAQQFSKKRKIDMSRWNFVTGNKDSIYKIAASYLTIAGEGEDNENHADFGLVHSGDFILVDNNGIIRSGYDHLGNPIGSYDGTSVQSVKDLIVDVGVLVKEIKRNEQNNTN